MGADTSTSGRYPTEPIAAVEILIRLGRFADGAEMSVALDQGHVLIAAICGTGTPSTLRTPLVGATRDPTAALVLVDAKRVERRFWKRRAT